jgi:hypothetical protein
MNQKVVAAILAALLGLGSIASNAFAFAAFSGGFNIQLPLDLANDSENSDADSKVTEPSIVDLRNLGKDVVPDLVGISVKDAYQLKTLSGYGFEFYKEDNLGALGQLEISEQASEDLFVCKQALPGGAELPVDLTESTIEVLVSPDCNGKTNSFLVGKAKASSSSWEPIRPTDETNNVVQGWVYGFAGEDENSKQVQIMTYSGVRDFELAMIEVIGTSGCGLDEAEWSRYLEQALEAKHSKLTIGLPIAAVLDWAESNESEAFFHALDQVTGNYLEEPPAGSVNEALVRDGYWVPGGNHITVGPEYVAAKKQKWISTDSYVSLTKLGKSYRKLILKAGNTKRKAPQPILATCISYETKEFISVYGGADVRWRYGILGGYVPSGCTWVNGYYRGNGYVRGHFRCG